MAGRPLTISWFHKDWLASVLMDISDRDIREDVAKRFADRIAASNNRFDREAFMKKCGL